MIKSCSECKVNCCRTGPGPYKIVSSAKYLDNFGYVSGYNTKCVNLSTRNKCKAWGTKKFPSLCRVHVCQTRKFSKQELSAIDSVVYGDEDSTQCPCPYCKCLWYLWDPGEDKGYCEVCGNKWKWKCQKA